MKYNCANEFDLDLIYKKLMSGSNTEMVSACDFFSTDNELELLQKKMKQLMFLKRKAKTRYQR